MLMQNFGVTNKEHYEMLWYFLEWSIGLELQKNNFPRAPRFFLRFLAVVARLRYETS